MKTENAAVMGILTPRELGTWSGFFHLTTKQNGHLSIHEGRIGREEDLHGKGGMSLGRWLLRAVLNGNRPTQGGFELMSL